MKAPLAVVIMGSGADEAHGKKIQAALDGFGVASEIRVASAHKDPLRVLRLLSEYEALGRPLVFITVAGRSNALSGLVDGAVSSPVIACPPPSEALGGADIWSSVRMPSGIAPAFVMEAGNAALLAAKTLSLADPSLRDRVSAAREAARAASLADDRRLAEERDGGAEPADGGSVGGAAGRIPG